MDALPQHDDPLADPHSQRTNEPEYAKNDSRSIRPGLTVLVAVCTHLGRIPMFRPEPGSLNLGVPWPGGFYCPCHGSKFDLAGRVFKNAPAPTNLEIPPYRFASDAALFIAVDRGACPLKTLCKAPHRTDIALHSEHSRECQSSMGVQLSLMGLANFAYTLSTTTKELHRD